MLNERTIFHKLIKSKQNKTSLLYFNYIFNQLSTLLVAKNMCSNFLWTNKADQGHSQNFFPKIFQGNFFV